ncbi:hypothetical protein D3C78_1916530 [compost metagenome]
MQLAAAGRNAVRFFTHGEMDRGEQCKILLCFISNVKGSEGVNNFSHCSGRVDPVFRFGGVALFSLQ